MSYLPLAHKKRKTIIDLETIRAKMTFTSIAIVLLSVFSVSFISVISEVFSARQKMINQLETVLSYKESALQTWIDRIQGDLESIIASELIKDEIETILPSSQVIPKDLEFVELSSSVREHFIQQISSSQYFDQIIVTDANGLIVVSTEVTFEGKSISDSLLFRVGLTSPYVHVAKNDPLMYGSNFYSSTPIFNKERNIVGVLAGRIRLTSLHRIINDRTGLGESGVTYLVGMDRQVLSGLSSLDSDKPVSTKAILSAFEGRNLGSQAYHNFDGEPVLGAYVWIPDLQAVLIAEQAREELQKVVYAELAVIVSVVLASIFVATMISLQLTRQIASPIIDLADVASRIATGEDSKEYVRTLPLLDENGKLRSDEIGVLAQTFETMTSQLATIISGLEQRAEERTKELESLTKLLQASAAVGQAATSSLDLEDILKQSVELIRDQFNLYYVGLFLADEHREWAVMRAGTGEAGKAMLARKHRLPIGQKSMIGWCIAHAKARIAQIAIDDSVRIINPELPNTRSEAALPLRSRGVVIGAISVQSEQINAFNEISLNVLQAMSDQLAVALDNARLFIEMQMALDGERRAYSSQTEKAWQSWSDQNNNLCFVSGLQGIENREPIWYPEMEQAYKECKTIIANDRTPSVTESIASKSNDGFRNQVEDRISLPIKIRGKIIGVLNITKKLNKFSKTAWSQDEISLLEELSDLLGVSLDSARMFRVSQYQAQREQLLGEISNRMRASLNIENIIKTSIFDIHKAFNLEKVELKLDVPNQEKVANT